MHAMVYRRYGSPDVLQLTEVAKPVATDDQVLVRVRAASLNPFDWRFMRGQPYIVRPTAGWFKPKRNIPGIDVAGVVEAVGRNVTGLRPGDEVFGEKGRACAEYVAGPETLFVAKPAGLTFEQAAAIPAAGVTALQALRDTGAVQPGQKVLINGASGGVGTFAVQIAKALGAEVAAVCSTPNVDLVRSLGADHVIDYTREDFTRSGQRYDLLVDNVGNRSFWALKRVVAPGGRLVLVGAPRGRLMIRTLVAMVAAPLISRFLGRKVVSHLTDTRREDLQTMLELIAAGKVTPVIDRSYPLSGVPDAIRYLETLRARGKVVITI